MCVCVCVHVCKQEAGIRKHVLQETWPLKPLQCLTEVPITGLLIILIGLLLQFSPLYAPLFLNMAVPVTRAGDCVKKRKRKKEGERKMSLGKSVCVCVCVAEKAPGSI